MSVHASNYSVQVFTASVDEVKIARIAHDAKLPYLVDLGAGAWWISGPMPSARADGRGNHFLRS